MNPLNDSSALALPAKTAESQAFNMVSLVKVEKWNNSQKLASNKQLQLKSLLSGFWKLLFVYVFLSSLFTASNEDMWRTCYGGHSSSGPNQKPN
ncbi:hypothetical protein V6N13_026546 [Hibiscus sabdariffa]|uniref:Uncharacterized protein n=1 Tax=Hibiscus sabdariffa TaxID=183260 RepID=A0ABR2BTD3_9ROSI